MSDAEDGKYRAPALDKGLDIVEYLASTESSRSQIEIAKALDRSPSEIYRMLDRLVHRNYVRRTPEDRYELTLKLYEIAHEHPPMRRLVAHATPVLTEYASRALQAAHLAVLDHSALVIVAQVDAPGYWSLAIRVGARIDMADTGSGHVMLAFAAPEQVQAITAHADAKVYTPQLRARLALVRERGFEMMASQQIEGVTNLAVPVFGPQRTVIGALACPFIRRLDLPQPADAEQALQMLLDAAAELSGQGPRS